MDTKEMELVERLGQIWNDFLELPVQHSSDNFDFMNAIHDAQRIIMARPAQRQLNEAKSKVKS